MYFGFRPAYPTYGMKVDNINNRNNIPINPMSYNMNMTISNNSNKQRNRFSKEEDECLRMLVEEQEDNVDWNYVSSKMIGRTSRQCRERYRNYLRPNLVNGSWTDEEDQLLEKMYEKFGPQWSKIAQYFPKRSDVNIKNHHTCIVNRLSRQKKRKASSSSSSAQNAESTNNSLFTYSERQNELEPDTEIMNTPKPAASPMFTSIQPAENTLMNPINNQIAPPEPNIPFVSNPMISNPMVSNPMMPNPMMSNPMVSNPMVSNPMINNPMMPNPMMQNPMVTNPMMTNPMVSNQIASTPITSNPMVSTNPIISTPIATNPIVSSPISNPTESISIESNPIDSNLIDSNPIDSSIIDSNPIDSNIIDSNPIDSNIVETNPIVSEPAPETTESNNNNNDSTLSNTAEQAPNNSSGSDTDNQQMPFNEDLFNELDFTFGELKFEDLPQGDFGNMDYV